MRRRNSLAGVRAKPVRMNAVEQRTRLHVERARQRRQRRGLDMPSAPGCGAGLLQGAAGEADRHAALKADECRSHLQYPADSVLSNHAVGAKPRSGHRMAAVLVERSAISSKSGERTT